MKKEKLQCDTARNISIIDFLKSEGYTPTKDNTKEAWYSCPFRDEKEASFKVSKSLNLWFDHGSGSGGNIIDLVTMLYCCNVTEALAILNRQNLSFSFQPQRNFAVAEKQDEIVIEKVVKLRHPALIGYLKSRSIDTNIAIRYAKQVHYRFKKHSFFAIGMQNISGGWELRNKFYKNSSSPKDFSFFASGNEMLCICEGIFDFFSLLTLYPALSDKSDFMVLNSVAFANRIHDKAKPYSKVCLYLDNDTAGKKATSNLLATIPNSVNMAALYESTNHNDLNDYLMALRK